MVSPTAQSLPADIIQEIFGYFSSTLKVHATEQFPWFLGHICSAWRTIFFKMNVEFWHSIFIEDLLPSPNERRINRMLETMKFFINCSQEATISFSYRVFRHPSERASRDTSHMQPFLELLVEESMRWVSVSIETNWSDLRVLRRIKDRLPSLRSLRLDLSPENDVPLDTFENAPSLRQLALVGCSRGWKLDWTSLTMLKLVDASLCSDELGILSQALNIEALTIKHGLVMLDGSVSAPITLPRLKRIALHYSVQYLSVLDAPELDELKLNVIIQGKDLESVTSFISKSSCHVQRLALRSPDRLTFTEILRHTPEIIHLELHEYVYFPDFIHCLKALDALSLDSINGDKAKLARHLKSLVISISDWRGPDQPLYPDELNLLMKVIKSRSRLGAGCPDGRVVERLETLTVLIPTTKVKSYSFVELETFCRNAGVAFRCKSAVT